MTRPPKDVDRTLHRATASNRFSWDETVRPPQVSPAKWYAERALFLDDEMWTAVEVELSRLSVLSQLEASEQILAALERIATNIEAPGQRVRPHKLIRLHALALLFEARTFAWPVLALGFPDADEEEDFLETFFPEETTTPGFRNQLHKKTSGSATDGCSPASESREIANRPGAGPHSQHTETGKKILSSRPLRKSVAGKLSKNHTTADFPSSASQVPLNVWNSFPGKGQDLRKVRGQTHGSKDISSPYAETGNGESRFHDMASLVIEERLTDLLRTARECLEEYVALHRQGNVSYTAKSHVDSIDRAVEDIQNSGNSLAPVSLAARMETLHEREKGSSKENAAFLKRVKISYALLFIETFHLQNAVAYRRARENVSRIRKLSTQDLCEFADDAARWICTSNSQGRVWLRHQILSSLESDHREVRNEDGFVSLAYLSPSDEILRASLGGSNLKQTAAKKRFLKIKLSQANEESAEEALAKARVASVLAESQTEQAEYFRKAQLYFSSQQKLEPPTALENEERRNV